MLWPAEIWICVVAAVARQEVAKRCGIKMWMQFGARADKKQGMLRCTLDVV
jgi:hypothetical protein